MHRSMVVSSCIRASKSVELAWDAIDALIAVVGFGGGGNPAAIQGAARMLD